MNLSSNLWQRRCLACAGGFIVAYCVAILGLVGTGADLRLRFLMVDDHPFGPGIEVIDTVGIETERQHWHGERPQVGDRLVSVGETPVENFLQYARAIWTLRTARTPPGGEIPKGSNPLQRELPKLVQEDGGPRWVEVGLYRPSTGAIVRTALPIRSVPLNEVALTLIWFVMQLVILSVGAVAFLNRPFDRPAQLFFAMCVVTLAAFVGGYHWWVLVGDFWFKLPFVACALLVPVVSLHFFLIYPRPKWPLHRNPTSVVWWLYVPAVVAGIGFLLLDSTVWGMVSRPAEAATDRTLVIAWLTHLRNGIYGYIGVAAVYFFGSLIALVSSVISTRNPVERNQVKFILWAGVAATIFIAYTLVLAYVSRREFVLGGARLPMFAASLVFMMAYAVGIIRYKLMLLDQVISRGVLYYILNFTATAAVAIAIGAGSLATAYWNQNLTVPQAVLMAGLLTIAVTLMLWARDSLQRAVDRRFFREKYRLDKALQRMNQAVGQMADPEFLSVRMLNSVCDVLQVSGAALYQRDKTSNQFRLLAAQGLQANQPLVVTVSDECLAALSQEGALARIPTETRENMSPVQGMLRDLRAELAHALEMDGEVAGVVILGPKVRGGLFTGEDVTFLTALGQITGVALRAAKIHQDLGHLNDELRLKTERLAQQKLQITMLQAELSSGNPTSPTTDPPEAFHRGNIKGSSPALLRVLDTVRKVAISETSVLIRGESGTGKELLAQAIHQNSPRARGPMVSVHCAALAANLLESELFGHAKGAFTGAATDRQGRFELANGGTLFLDEIGDISPETQVKLLRVLQQREFEPVGSTKTVRVDVRVLAATHQDLEGLISTGKFREDLYYRLNVISVTLPSLRERREDLIELATGFLQRAVKKTGKQIHDFDDDALVMLMQHDWPGNIRELENVIERAVVLADHELITTADLPPDFRTRAGKPSGRRSEVVRPTPSQGSPIVSSPFQFKGDGDDRQEREELLRALQQCQGNKAEAARLLGLPRSTYFSRLKKHGL